MNQQYILTIDQSTSGSKVMVIDNDGKIIAKQSKEHKQFYPQPGWVEHDPIEIYSNIISLVKRVIDLVDITTDELKMLTLTNQRETVVLWDKDTGQPVYNAIVWQCSRTKDICAKLNDGQINSMIKKKTGLLLDPYFSATKIKWLLENIEGAKEKAVSGALLAGTIDSWLIWNLTEKEVHASDYTNASRTLLFNINKICWDEELLNFFQIPAAILPDIRPSDDIYGYTNISGILDKKIPISGVIGDSQGALFGQKCFKIGMVKATYGTGTSVLMNIGQNPVFRDNLVTSIAWGFDGDIIYAFEGIIRSSGDTLNWLKNNLGLFKSFSEIEPLMEELNDNEGVYLVPAFSGLGIPYWNMAARAAITGMTRKTDRRNIIRAAVESIAYQVTDAIKLMVEESGVNLSELRADGGASSNSFLMQFQADILDVKISVSQVAELSALGAAYLGGLSIGIWESIDQITKEDTDTVVYQGSIEPLIRDRYYSGWQAAVRKVLN